MSKTIALSDEHYRIIEQVAATQGQTPDTLLTQWIEELRDRDRNPRYYETDEWLRHLGVSAERLQRANTRVAEHEARVVDADA